MKARNFMISLACFVLASFSANGQNFRQKFEAFTNTALKAHQNFSDSVNFVFSKTISSNWEKFLLSEPESSEKTPQPDYPTVADRTNKVVEGAVKVYEVVDTLSLSILEDIPDSRSATSISNSRIVKFPFYDAVQTVDVPCQYGLFHPSGISEPDVGEFWYKLSQESYNLVISQCVEVRDKFGLNDWGILKWVQALSAAVFPDDVNSERTVFQVFVLNQLGLMVKLTRVDNRLECLFASQQQVYARKYIVIDTYQYYMADATASVKSVYTYRCNFSGRLRPLDLRIKNTMTLGIPSTCSVKKFTSQVFDCVLDIPINKTFISFYDSYPQTTINVYAQSNPDAKFSESLLNQLKSRLEGHDKNEAINELLRFLQYDFSYKVDSEQFGFEKQFFCEENFYYDANDCEDRAVLFSFLVRRLLGLKVVLLEYDNHICSAVCLERGGNGHYIKLGNEKYFICDPTYIGATAGMCMTKYIDKPARVYVL